MKNDKDLDNNDESTPKKSISPNQPESTITTTKGKKDNRSNVPKNDDDGDEYDPTESFRGGKYSYPPSYTMYEKISKETAEYKQGMPFHNCGKCNYYQAGHCKIVRGYIAQSMGCKYFSEKYTPMIVGIAIKRK